MSSMTNIHDYFTDKEIPKVHPFQDVQKTNTYTEKNKQLDRDGQTPFGYNKNERTNTNKSYKSLKVEK